LTETTRRHGGIAREGVLLVVMAVVLAVFLRTFVAQAFSIPSESMEPQLDVGDRVVVSRLAYHLHDPNRGDVIVFDKPGQVDHRSFFRRGAEVVLESVGLRQASTEEYIKRVIGLPGETVQGVDGGVVVDGQPVVEPYLPEGTVTSDFGPVVVPEGELFVMGDNRTNSEDSRFIGTIPIDTVVGRAFVRLWPPGRTAFL
jgi:signal peptidase I